MKDKFQLSVSKYAVGWYTVGRILSEWTDLDDAKEHRDAVAAQYPGKSPYCVYTREEWEGGYKA